MAESGKIGETRTIKVSTRGDGLCLYLSKEFCKTHGIIAGHRLKVQFLDHLRQSNPEPTVPPNCGKGKREVRAES